MWLLRLLFAVSFMGLAASSYAASDSTLIWHYLTPDQIQQAIEDNRMPRGANIAVTALGTDEKYSYHLVQILGAERLHRHNEHSSNVLLWRGRGVLLLDGRPQYLDRGDETEIPVGLPHRFINQFEEASIAVVRFSPHYFGEDKEYLD